MHTFNDDHVLVISNGDFSGDVTIKWPKSDRHSLQRILDGEGHRDIDSMLMTVTIPGTVLFRVLRHMLSRKLESALERFRDQLWEKLEDA